MGQVQNEEHLCLIAVIGADKSHRGTGVQEETEWRLGRMVCDERDSQNERRE